MSTNLPEPVTSAIEEAKVKMLARLIQGQEHFESVMQSADPGMRRGVYDKLKPYLRFKPKPFCLLKFTKIKKAPSDVAMGN